MLGMTLEQSGPSGPLASAVYRPVDMLEQEQQDDYGPGHLVVPEHVSQARRFYFKRFSNILFSHVSTYLFLLTLL